MSSLSVTRSLVSMTNPTEAQFDSMRTSLLNYFNAASMTQANLAAGACVYSTLSKALDNAKLAFTSNTAFWNYVSASTTFEMENTAGDFVFKNTATSTLVESLRMVAATGKTTIGDGGLLSINQAVGSIAVTTQWLLARYRKPRLEYTSANIITSAENGPNASETLLLLRDRLTTVVDRTMDITATANGYDAAHVGAAVSGIRSGLARAANTWYFIYGVEVQYGTDNSGAKSILVADTTTPVQANCATLDTRYGAGKWVYLGVIRNGYNDGVSTNVIVPFVYDGYGGFHFTTAAESGLGYGLTLASSTANSADLTYDIAFGTTNAVIPVTCGRGVLTGYRSKDGFQVDYVNIASGEIQAQGTCCADTDTTTTVVAAVFLEVPFISGYRVTVRVGTNASNNRIKLVSMVDHYV